MIESRKERARYLREMNRSIREILVPELSSSRALDLADSIDHVLKLFVLEEEFGPELCRETSDQLAETLSNISRLLEERNRAAPLSENIKTGLKSVSENDPAVVLERMKALAQETIREMSGLVQGDIPELTPLVGDLIRIEKAFQDRVGELRDDISKSMSVTKTIVSETGGSITAKQLTDYLRNRFPQSPNLTIKNLIVIPGGHSKETFIFEVENAPELPSQLVLRKDKGFSWTDTKSADEYGLLKVLYDAGGIPVPGPVLFENDASVLEGTFLIMEKVEGQQGGEFYPERRCVVKDRRLLGEQLAQIFARIHSIDIRAFQGTHLNLEPDQRAVLTKRINTYYERIRESETPANFCAEFACQWLLEHMDDAISTEELCLNYIDVGLHNMLVREDRITALLDWELAEIGPPASDLGSILYLIETLMPWDEFAEIYIRNGGSASACSAEAIRYYSIMKAMGSGTFTGLARKLFRGGLNEFLYADAGYDRNFRACKLLADTLGSLFD